MKTKDDTPSNRKMVETEALSHLYMIVEIKVHMRTQFKLEVQLFDTSWHYEKKVSSSMSPVSLEC